MIRAGSRPVHLRSIRPRKRRFAAHWGEKAAFAPNSERRAQVQAVCGEWVFACEAVRTDRAPRGRVTCAGCLTATQKKNVETKRSAA
jgi:hypothetical protein